MHTWLEINKHALYHNISQFKQIVHNRALAPVIKSNAYGHGAVCIAQLLEADDGVAFLCCASLSEALVLRAAGIKKPLLVLGIVDVPPAHADDAVAFMTGDLRLLYELNEIGRVNNRIFAVHLKIDTGLSRFGIMPADAVSTIAQLKQLRHLDIQGIATHLADAHNADQSYTVEQLVLFDKVVTDCAQHGWHFKWVHSANSAATLSHDLPMNTLFRVGLALYGLWPSQSTFLAAKQRMPSIDLIPILTWKTSIIAIKEVASGSFVGYKKTFKTKRTTKIGIMPVGYYDGYDFRLSNKAVVLINGQYASVIGRICMNLTMIDITDIATVDVATSVTLLGSSEKISAYALAHLMEQDNVRLCLTALGNHLSRVVMHAEQTPCITHHQILRCLSFI